MSNSETSQPEVIWARLDNSTLYADGSSPCVARTKKFANGARYVRADVVLGALMTALSELRDYADTHPSFKEIADAIAKAEGTSDLGARMRKGAGEFAAILKGSQP